MVIFTTQIQTQPAIFSKIVKQVNFVNRGITFINGAEQFKFVFTNLLPDWVDLIKCPYNNTNNLYSKDYC